MQRCLQTSCPAKVSEICVHSDLCMSLHSIVVVTVHSSPGELACLFCSSCVYVEMYTKVDALSGMSICSQV